MPESTLDYRKFYNLEEYLFGEVRPKFAESGKIEPLDFYLMLHWKSPRSRTTTRDRLTRIAGSFSRAVEYISRSLTSARNPEQRLKLLMTSWKFQLPTATAILTILYPEDFTVYDVRVVGQLKDFDRLAALPFSDRMWNEYLRYKRAVEESTPNDLSLRDKDRWSWGKSLYEQCASEIAH
jgi:hypothetical protein